MREGQIGRDQAIDLVQSLDTWEPAVRGSAARVYRVFYRDEQNSHKKAAFKVMRPDKKEYASPLFFQEVIILSRMQDVRGVIKIREFGFAMFNNLDKIKEDSNLSSLSGVTGSVRRYSIREEQDFTNEYNTRVSEGWLPYLIIDELPVAKNMWLLCDEYHTKGKLFDIELGKMAILQACSIFSIAHQRNIVYRDHKILHYYWDDRRKQIEIIDWNIGMFFQKGAPVEEKKFDVVLFGVFAFWVLTGRPLPGSLKLGPTTPDDIKRFIHEFEAFCQDAEKYKTIWRETDQQRLNGMPLREIIDKALQGKYPDADALHQDLTKTY